MQILSGLIETNAEAVAFGCQLELREIQLAELELLKRFDTLCKQHDLCYSLVGGTLLGAVRHKGFIPWDDDIDVAMSRPDYEKLRSLAHESLEESPYRLIGFPTNDSTDPVFSKLIDERIAVKDVYREELTNLWIDIFPIDGLPADDKKVARIYRKAHRLRTLTLTSHADLSSGRTPLRRALKNVFHPFDKMFHIGKHCERALNELATTYPYEGAEYVGCIVWGLYGVGEKLPADAFLKIVEMEFEGKQFPAMYCWDDYLGGIYGNYMELPPEDQRKVHEMKVWYVDDGQEVEAR